MLVASNDDDNGCDGGSGLCYIDFHDVVIVIVIVNFVDASKH